MEKLLTKYFWVFNLVTLVLIALFLARGGAEWISAQILANFPVEIEQAASKVSTPTRTSPSKRFRAPDGAIILQRNIFDSTTGALAAEEDLPDPEDGDELTGAGLPIVPCPAGTAKLLAAVASNRDPDWSFVTVQEGKETKLYRVGDEIGNRRVSDISWRHVFLRGGSDECFIDMFGDQKELARKPKKKRGGPASDIADGIEVVSETERNVDRSLIDKVISNPTQFAKSVRVRPYKRNGKVEGFKIRRVGKDSPLSLLGAKRGDIIKGVNGQELTSVDKALGLYQALRTSNELVFDIVRKGKPVEMKINIR